MPYPRSENGYWMFGDQGYPVVGARDDNVVDDFESQGLDGYDGDLSDFSIQGSTVLQGRYSLTGSARPGAIAGTDEHYETPRPEEPVEYSMRTIVEGRSAAYLLVCVQFTPNPFRSCYAVEVSDNTGNIRLIRRQSGSGHVFEEISASITSDTEYRPYITISEEGVTGGLRDSNDNELESFDSYYDDTFSGGYYGLRTTGGTSHFDYVTREEGEMGDISEAWIEHFGRGNLSPYEGPASSGTASVTSSAGYNSDNGLLIDGYEAIFSLPGMGLDSYPREGEPFELYFNPQSNSTSQYWFYLCPQGTYSHTVDGYTFEVLMDGYTRIFKDRSVAPGSSSGASYNWSTNNWYRAEILLDSSSGVEVDVYDASSGSHEVSVATTDTEYISGESGIGFRSSGGGRFYVDEIREIR